MGTPEPPPLQRPTKSEPKPGWDPKQLLPLLLVGVVLLVIMWLPRDTSTDSVDYDYSSFVSAVDDATIETAVINADGSVTGETTDGSTYRTQLPEALAGEELLARLERGNVDISAKASTPSVWSTLLGVLFTLGPFALIIGFWVYLSRKAGSGVGSALGMGRSKAKVFDTEHPATTFDDVAGYESVKREITEIADFLRNPDRFRNAGAKTPRGVLMTGPPGTGKTLMARALAGEVGVPFLSVTGSSFVEMFVGVGAARVRDLFAEARKVAPAIIFVDEIDAIGQRRQVGAMISNDEREQTLNQLLSEMDGFDPSVEIIVLAATNRPEVLDAALLRPGRFDRQVVIPLPNQREREAILAVHCRGKQLDGVDLDEVSRGTPGFSGADLANLINEAAIRAAREDRRALTAADIDAARDRILIGQRDRSTVLLPEERHAVSVHESGHALVAALCPHADPVHKVTILPAGRALGVTQQLPEHERHLYSEQFLYDTLAVMLGGRAAERVVFDQGSTGAANDLASATDLAVKMVTDYGLSPTLGPVSYERSGPMFLGPESMVASRRYADETQRAIDLEVARILLEAEQRAIMLVSEHRNQLDVMVERLLHDETIDGEVVYEIVGRPRPAPRPQVLSDRQPDRDPDEGDHLREVDRSA